MEQKTHKHLVSGRQGVLPLVAPVNHAMMMDPSELTALEGHDILVNMSGASDYDDPWTFRGSYAAEHDY